VLVGEFSRTPGGRPKSKGFENPFQNNPTPCKIKPKQPEKQWVTIQEWICAQNRRKKMKKMKNLGEMGFRGKKGKNPNVRPAVGGLTGERPAVGRGVVGK
jgi:hypothetical protein